MIYLLLSNNDIHFIYVVSTRRKGIDYNVSVVFFSVVVIRKSAILNLNSNIDTANTNFKIHDQIFNNNELSLGQAILRT